MTVAVSLAIGIPLVIGVVILQQEALNLFSTITPHSESIRRFARCH